MKQWIGVVVVILLSVVPLRAIDECVADDIRAVINSTNFITDYNAVIRDFTSMRTVAEVDAGIERATSVYTIWWDEIMPEIADCGGASADIILAGSRAADELVITALYTRTMTTTLLENQGVATAFFEDVAERTAIHADNVVEYYGMVIEFMGDGTAS